jgi:hypothetical protein
MKKTLASQESKPASRSGAVIVAGGVGYARRVMPKGRWGAPELVARFSHEVIPHRPLAPYPYE